VTVASILASQRESLRGNVKFIFQPAEERIGGARPMIDAGALRDPNVDAIVGFHLWNYLPVGKVGVRAGPTFASADEMRITIRGRMGHGALPHQAVDSIAVAAQVITALQTLVAREVDPVKPAVVTIGTIDGGTAFNIIAPEVHMLGTIRAFDLAVRNYLVDRVEGLVAGICAAMRAQYEFHSVMGCPPCVNDPQMAALVRQAAGAVIGVDNVVTIDPTTGSDDMAYFLAAVPGCYFNVGSGNLARGLGSPHHTPQFDFDEESLVIGAQVLLETVFAYLSEQ
jgi:amidohydrolase